MPAEKKQFASRVLTPIERFSEMLFGVIMVLTFTCSISVAEAGREDIRTMLFSALGCNLAWGLIDAVLYLTNTLAERGRGLVVLRRVHSTADASEGRSLIAEAMPPLIASVLTDGELESLRERIIGQCVPPARIPVKSEDFRGACGVFLLVFFSTFPIVIPFLFMRDVGLALRASNGIAIVILYMLGSRLAHHMGGRPWLMGSAMVFLGAALVALAIALGG